jgi:hypothetical protein
MGGTAIGSMTGIGIGCFGPETNFRDLGILVNLGGRLRASGSAGGTPLITGGINGIGIGKIGGRPGVVGLIPTGGIPPVGGTGNPGLGNGGGRLGVPGVDPIGGTPIFIGGT